MFSECNAKWNLADMVAAHTGCVGYCVHYILKLHALISNVLTMMSVSFGEFYIDSLHFNWDRCCCFAIDFSVSRIAFVNREFSFFLVCFGIWINILLERLWLKLHCFQRESEIQQDDILWFSCHFNRHNQNIWSIKQTIDLCVKFCATVLLYWIIIIRSQSPESVWQVLWAKNSTVRCPFRRSSDKPNHLAT